MVEPDEMLWVPVRMGTDPDHRSENMHLVLPNEFTSLEAVPGIKPTGEAERMICICTELPVHPETRGGDS